MAACCGGECGWRATGHGFLLSAAPRASHSRPLYRPSARPQIIKLSKELPVVVEYRVAEMGYVRYYLAPKIEVGGWVVLGYWQLRSAV